MSITLAFLGDFGDAFDYIFNSRESQAGGARVGGSELLPLLWTHLEVTALAMGIAIAIALPIGLALGHTGRGAFAAISVSNTGRAVPSVALIAFFVAFFPRTPEFWNVTVALALLAIPPILTNAYVGVRQVSPEAVDAARGMGMSAMEIVRGFAKGVQAMDEPLGTWGGRRLVEGFWLFTPSEHDSDYTVEPSTVVLLPSLS